MTDPQKRRQVYDEDGRPVYNEDGTPMLDAPSDKEQFVQFVNDYRKRGYEQPSAREMGLRLIDALPTIGGAVGGTIGGVGGTAFGLGFGGVPGALGGATLGGAAGESGRQLLNRLIGREAPATPSGAARQIAEEGAKQFGYQGAGLGLRTTARVGSRAALNAGSDVIETALRERALPGFFRSGASRTADRIREVAEELRAPLAAHGRARVSRNRIASTPKTWDVIQNTGNAEPGRRAAEDVVQNWMTNIKLKPPTANAAFNVAEGSFGATLGKTDAASLMDRAMASNAVGEVGRVVPGAAVPAARYQGLQRVAAAHAATDAARGIAPGMAPTMNLRLAIAATNRGLAPTLQGMYRAGQALSPEALRAIMLTELLSRPGASK